MIQSFDARMGTVVADVGEETAPGELEARCRQAALVAGELEEVGRCGRAAMLTEMAAALEGRGVEIVETADRETALGEARLRGELARSCFQLRFMAEVITDGAYLEVAIDHAGDTPAGPRPDLRRMLRPLGPVAVFGASNFPLAFSVPGGDTASALAAGCPVLVKVHPAHPATSVLAAEALAEGASKACVDLPVVSLVFGEEAGAALVEHPAIKAVGFTGSLSAGRHLYELACGRPSPVPFYGELGALNAVVVAPAAASRRAEEIASALTASFSLGVGQFCTKPGLVLLPDGAEGRQLVGLLAEKVRRLQAGRMLSERISRGYLAGAAALGSLPATRVLAVGERPGTENGWWATPLLLEASIEALTGPLLDECFGPVLVVAHYGAEADLFRALGSLPPALTASIQADLPDDEAVGRRALEIMSAGAGRLVWNGYPTGVAVAWAMHHGGPYPATTDVLHTSVGASSVRRWLRPVCYQDLPEQMLPPELHDDAGPSHTVPRRVDGRLVLPRR